MTRPLLISFIIGFVTASPVGPVGIFCLRRAVSDGIKAAMASAFGIAIAYALWAFASIHGLREFSVWMERKKDYLQIGTGLIFFLYGLHAVLTSPNTSYPALQRSGKAFGFIASFLIVGLNPATFIMFSALFTLSGVPLHRMSVSRAIALSTSVFLGSTAFWTILSFTIHKGKTILPESFYIRISALSAYAIIGFSTVIIVVNLLKQWLLVR